MNKLVRLSPMPEELDRSYLGRLMRINGFANEKEARVAMEDMFALKYNTPRERNTLEPLSLMAGQSIEKFAQSHSLIPFRRAITSFAPELEHGSSQRRTVLSVSGMAPVRQGAYFCSECVLNDIGSDGIDYWRRDHQIPGQLWCQQHQHPLQYIDDQSAYLSSPSEYLTTAVSVPKVLIDTASSDQRVQTFMEIATGLMERTFPLEVMHVALALREKANERNLQTFGGKVRRPLLSDLIKRSFPNQWLDTVVAGISEKPDGQILNHVDGVLYMRNSASSVSSYILAASVLYSSADDALNSLLEAHITHAEPLNRRIGCIPEDQPEQLLDVYRKCQGEFSKIAMRMGRPMHQVRSSLQLRGLPNLSNRTHGQNKLAALSAFRLDGKSSTESAEIGGLTLDEMDDLNRNSGPELNKVLMKMKRQEKPLNGGRKIASLPWSLDEPGKQQSDAPQILETEFQN